MFDGHDGFVGHAVGDGIMEPVNPNATEEARRVLNYLESLPQGDQNRILSGQHVKYVQSSYDELMYIDGRSIALLGLDYSGRQDYIMERTNGVIQHHWDRGGLVMVCWLPDNPWTGGDFWDTDAGDLADLYTPGNSAYDNFLAECEFKVGHLANLQDVVILWRPLPEMNGNWFWWGDHDRDKFIALWQHIFSYFTSIGGLNDLLWVYSAYKTPVYHTRHRPAYYYPDGFADIVGIGSYGENNDLVLLPEEGYIELLELGKPIALAEFGPLASNQGDNLNLYHSYDYTRLTTEIKQYAPQLVLFATWWDSFAIANQNNGAELLDDPWVITLEEIQMEQGIPEHPRSALDILGDIKLGNQSSQQELGHVVASADSLTSDIGALNDRYEAQEALIAELKAQLTALLGEVAG